MTKPAIDKPVRRRAVFTSYAVLWSMLGTLGVGYLGVAIFEPQWLGDLTPTRSDSQRAEIDATVTKLAADVNDLKSSMAKVELDVSSVKSDVATQAQQTQMLGTQLTALDDKVRLAQTPVASNESPPSATPDTQQPANDAVASANSGAPSDADGADQPLPETRILNAAPEKSQIVTGSVDKRPSKPKSKTSAASGDAVSFGTSVVKPVHKPIGIELASAASVNGLRLNWLQLSTEHADKLKRLKARYTTNGNSANPNFNLVAGPIRTKAEAIRLCHDLQSQAVSCSVGDFTGNAL